MNVPERGSRFDEALVMSTLVDPPMCINCNLPEPQGRSGWDALELISRGPTGGFDTLESWPVCPDCSTGGAATLVRYVKLALS